MTPLRRTHDGGLIGSACVTTSLCARFATGLDLRLIGDALAPRRVDAAIREGELAGRAI